ncbi:type II toxin-antitoxin system VapC family toxin [Azospirillum sp. RWY-5-1]|uniref:Ribonuclease VapC n=1 Tax=Azospirillum oleiclasticum TaxID=2735135 RepID=A0ABX2TMJ2_9PROT|nr:type II toxin-antitoxin system VapC family toxin [Azospirillum oleiclasticum]NYZ24634.1 type II toxin-antitoxin system VapC family toxin [Azospirillum oleiclasticum]
MVVDTSAIMAILLAEPDAVHYARAIGKADACLISAATALECSIVSIARFGNDATLSAWMADHGFEVVPVDAVQVALARDAFLRFGKGRHPAALNYGDCFSYALAKARREPLLFKGRDFSQADLPSALDSLQ